MSAFSKELTKEINNTLQMGEDLKENLNSSRLKEIRVFIEGEPKAQPRAMEDAKH